MWVLQQSGWNSRFLEFQTRVSIPFASYPRRKGCDGTLAANVKPCQICCNITRKKKWTLEKILPVHCFVSFNTSYWIAICLWCLILCSWLFTSAWNVGSHYLKAIHLLLMKLGWLGSLVALKIGKIVS